MLNFIKRSKVIPLEWGDIRFKTLKNRKVHTRNDSSIFGSFKNVIFIGVGKKGFREGEVEK